MKGLILLGIGFDVISTFLKWGDPNLYLPWSLSLSRGYILPRRGLFPLVSVLMKIGAVAAWIGFILLEFLEERHRMGYLLVLASAFLSLSAAAVFSSTGVPVSWGMYSAAVGGMLKIVAVILGNIGIEIVYDGMEG